MAPVGHPRVNRTARPIPKVRRHHPVQPQFRPRAWRGSSAPWRARASTRTPGWWRGSSTAMPAAPRGAQRRAHYHYAGGGCGNGCALQTTRFVLKPEIAPPPPHRDCAAIPATARVPCVTRHAVRIIAGSLSLWMKRRSRHERSMSCSMWHAWGPYGGSSRLNKSAQSLTWSHTLSFRGGHA